MAFVPRPLPWPMDSLKGFISARTNDIHYNQHYLGYIKKLNESGIVGLSLEQIVMERVDRMGDYAAQVLNHDHFWGILSPNPGPLGGPILDLINDQYGSFDNFRHVFETRVADHFASGWIWLAWDPETQMLMVLDGQDAYNPMKDGYLGLLTLDAWEHAFEIDYGSDKVSYSKNFWHYVNWPVINQIVQANITIGPMF